MKPIFHLTIGRRFTIATMLIVVGLITASFMLTNALIKIEAIVSEKSHDLATKMSVNAEVTRTVYQLSSRVQLLEQTYLHDNDILIEENLLIDDQLQYIKQLSKDPEFIGRMEVFIQSFHRFLGGSLSLNRILHERNDIDIALGEKIDRIEYLITESHLLDGAGDIVERNALLSHLAIHSLRENYLHAARTSVSIRSRITPDTEKVLLIDLEKELSSLRVNLNAMTFYGGEVERVVVQSLALVDDYLLVLRKMQANLFQRWQVMHILMDSQVGLIDYIVNNESEVRNDALTVESELREKISTLKLLVIFLAGFIILFSIIGFEDLVRRHIRRPIRAFVRGIDNLEAGQLKKHISLGRNDEWSTIETAFNNMASRLDDTYEELMSERKALNYIAHHDTLTGLCNRLFAYEKIESLINQYHEHNKRFSLIYLDLDNFKQVNDTLGHDVGDKLLKKIASILSTTIADCGDVIRLGGDEFMVLFADIDTSCSIEKAAKGLSHALQEKIEVDTFSVVVGSSIGICHFPEHGDNVDVIIRNADTAMYAAKNMGGNNICIYQDHMTSEVVDFTQKISGIRRAIKSDEFFLVYQPKFDLVSGNILGVEALIRWQHPEWGIIAPNDFLSVAEEAGLIGAIDSWVFETAALQIVEWKKKGYVVDDLQVSINFSGRKFVEPGLLENLRYILDKTQCPASMIEIEITEQDVMTRVEDRNGIMKQLKGMGFSLAIDDFGTGYSSFNYLKHLPVDTLKIDASFIRDISYDNRDMAIVRTMVSLATMLDLNIVAEGIETYEQKCILMDCDPSIIGQGYFLAKPMPLDELTVLLASRTKYASSKSMKKLIDWNSGYR